MQLLTDSDDEARVFDVLCDFCSLSEALFAGSSFCCESLISAHSSSVEDDEGLITIGILISLSDTDPRLPFLKPAATVPYKTRKYINATKINENLYIQVIIFCNNTNQNQCLYPSLFMHSVI